MYFLTHIKCVIQQCCYQLNEQDMMCGMGILKETKEITN